MLSSASKVFEGAKRRRMSARDLDKKSKEEEAKRSRAWKKNSIDDAVSQEKGGLVTGGAGKRFVKGEILGWREQKKARARSSPLKERSSPPGSGAGEKSGIELIKRGRHLSKQAQEKRVAGGMNRQYRRRRTVRGKRAAYSYQSSWERKKRKRAKALKFATERRRGGRSEMKKKTDPRLTLHKRKAWA